MTDNPLLDVLTREGVLLNVSVRFWRGCKKLKAEDIGLDPDNVSSRLISLGHKRLLPKEATAALALVEGRAHALVESCSFPFLNGLAHFLPNAKLEEVTTKLKGLEGEFWKAKGEFIQSYARLRESAAKEWRDMAKKLVSDPERVVANIETAFPAPQRMDRFFGFETQLFQIAVPERLGLDMVAMADHQKLMQVRREAAQRASQQIHAGVERFVDDCVAALREQTAQLCDEMLQSISGSETGVHQKTLNRLVRFIDEFKQMNFVNDTEMEQRLQQVRNELLAKTAEEYRDNASARARLVNGLSRLRDQASQMARENGQRTFQHRAGPTGIGLGAACRTNQTIQRLGRYLSITILLAIPPQTLTHDDLNPGVGTRHMTTVSEQSFRRSSSPGKTLRRWSHFRRTRGGCRL